MQIIMAILIGVLYAAGLYMIMRRSLGKMIIGLVLLSHAANLLIFVVGGLVRAATPLVPEGAEGLGARVADPLAQALILTAIVISFAVLAFTVVLLDRIYRRTESDDLDDLRATDT